MDEKKEKCKRCGIKIEPKTKRAEFCSPKCKVYWHRENSKAVVKVNNLTKPTFPTKTWQKTPAQNESINTTLPEALHLAQLKAYEDELERLKPLNETTLTKRRIQFLNTKISELKKQSK